jgi:hypothetical protein
LSGEARRRRRGGRTEKEERRQDAAHNSKGGQAATRKSRAPNRCVLAEVCGCDWCKAVVGLGGLACVEAFAILSAPGKDLLACDEASKGGTAKQGASAAIQGLSTRASELSVACSAASKRGHRGVPNALIFWGRGHVLQTCKPGPSQPPVFPHFPPLCGQAFEAREAWWMEGLSNGRTKCAWYGVHGYVVWWLKPFWLHSIWK